MKAHDIKSQAEFARRVGENTTKINNYFRGLSRPELSTGITIREHFRVTLDWLYLGEESGLPANVYLHLEKAANEQVTPEY